MSYGKNMRAWEANKDRIEEERWLAQLSSAILSKNRQRVRALMVTGIVEDYSFPDFTPGTWQSELYQQVLEEES